MRSEEEKFLFNRIYDDFYVQFPQGAHLSELIEAFNCKKILVFLNTDTFFDISQTSLP